MNPVTTALTLNMQLPNIATVSWAVQGDTLSRQIEAALVDGSIAWNPQAGYIGVIRFFKPDGTNGVYDTDEGGNPAVTWTGNIATIKVAQQCLAVPGTVMMDLEFYDANAARVSAFGWAMNVQPSAVTDNEFLSSDYYNILEKQIAGVLGASGHAPYINDTTKNWMIWDDNAGDYVDSGYSSVGEQGPQGPQGVSIISTTKDSGTGAPGTTDVYDVNLSNGTVAGQFSVYNGSDGQGSPGSQLPIMDGIAATGSATAYSREDHVHPSDTSKADQVVIAGVEASTTAANSYAIGEYLILDGALYRVTVAITAGDTITDTGGSANVEAVTVGSELSGLKNTLNSVETNVGKIIPVITGTTNNSGYTINAGDYFEANGALYKASAAIPIDTAWIGTALSVTAINQVNKDLSDLMGFLGVKVGTVTMRVTGTSHLSVRQCGHIVSIWGYIDGMSLPANTETIIATISNVLLPADTVRIRGAVGANAYSPQGDAYIGIGTNGTIGVTPVTTGSTLYFNATYIR